MIDNRFHNETDEYKKINYEANKVFYDPDKPRIKDILWKQSFIIQEDPEEERNIEKRKGQYLSVPQLQIPE